MYSKANITLKNGFMGDFFVERGVFFVFCVRRRTLFCFFSYLAIQFEKQSIIKVLSYEQHKKQNDKLSLGHLWYALFCNNGKLLG